jgi:hypothetical protein
MTKKITKVCYEVEYYPSNPAFEISNMMSKLDLGIERISTVTDFSWTTTTRVTKWYIKTMKDQLWLAVIAGGGKPIRIDFKEKHEEKHN